MAGWQQVSRVFAAIFMAILAPAICMLALPVCFIAFLPCSLVAFFLEALHASKRATRTSFRPQATSTPSSPTCFAGVACLEAAPSSLHRRKPSRSTSFTFCSCVGGADMSVSISTPRIVLKTMLPMLVSETAPSQDAASDCGDEPYLISSKSSFASDGDDSSSLAGSLHEEQCMPLSRSPSLASNTSDNGSCCSFAETLTLPQLPLPETPACKATTCLVPQAVAPLSRRAMVSCLRHSHRNAEVLLGEGSRATVIQVAIAGTQYAVKIVVRNRSPYVMTVAGGAQQQQQQEVGQRVMEAMTAAEGSAFVVSFCGLVDTGSCAFVFMEAAERSLDMLLDAALTNAATEAAAAMEAARTPAPQQLLAPLHVIRTVGRSALQGLAALHAGKFAHRDIKPSNILLTSSGGAKLGGLGLAARTDKNGVLCGSGEVGSAGYIAPEVRLHEAAWRERRCGEQRAADSEAQQQGATAACEEACSGEKHEQEEKKEVVPLISEGYIGLKADIFSLGVTLAECAVWYGNKGAVLEFASGVRALPPCVPADLQHVIMAMTCPEPVARAGIDTLLGMPFFRDGA